MMLSVIVRAAGERTADYCCAELARQTSAHAVQRVELTPFWRTLREGLERGLKTGAPWILSVDADMIPTEDAVIRVSRWIDRVDAGVGVLSGMFQDKLLGGIRFGGVRLYRAAAVPDLLDLMPALGQNVRPESTAISRLGERGWRHELVPELLGLHDYEQYYRDIYRKAFLHMQKHGYTAGRFIVLWKEQAGKDPDYRVALGGSSDALLQLAEVDCDASHAAFKPELVMQRLGLEEKPALTRDRLDYHQEIERWQAGLDAGEVEPISPPDQEAFDSARPVADVVRRIERIGNNLKLFAGVSDLTRAAALHQVRRALPDEAILDTFSGGELARYAAHRFIRRARGR